MTESSAKAKKQDGKMDVINAIYQRHAVRSYLPAKPDEETIKFLLDAARHAPSAMNEQPWAFAVIQDKKTLEHISKVAKKMIPESDESGHNFERFLQPDFSVFYDAPTLIVIYGKPLGDFVAAECWLAAENLMLAACSIGLGTCVIGLAISALNSREIKEELGIPSGMTAYAPIIVGTPRGDILPVAREEPEILVWKK